MTLLAVEDLRIDLVMGDRRHGAVDKVSFEIARGETFGLVGESGCGKSITALAIMGLLQRPLEIGGGSIKLDGRAIENLDADEMRRLRGKRLAMIFQEPMTALNPLLPSAGRSPRCSSCTRARAGATPSAAPSKCWRACAFRRPSGARATIRTSSPAACASA